MPSAAGPPASASSTSTNDTLGPMREVIGNLWDFYDRGAHVAITTNGSISGNNLAVMGRGVALEAKQRFPALPRQLANKLRPAPANRRSL